jgi:hypothetical protein
MTNDNCFTTSASLFSSSVAIYSYGHHQACMVGQNHYSNHQGVNLTMTTART